MIKKFIFNFLYVFLIIFVILALIYTISILKSNAGDCLRNPIGYFEEKNNATCWTSCMKDGKIYDFWGDKSGIIVKKNDTKQVYEPFNLTLFESITYER